MKSAWDCGRTRLMTDVGIQPFGRENTHTPPPNSVPLLGQRELGRPAPRGGGHVCRQGTRTPCCPTPSDRGGTCLQVHAEEPGEAGTVGVPRQRLQDDAAQPGLGPAVGRGSRQ